MLKFELRKIKYFDAGSEETPCFTAEIWENGKKVADVSNEGHGGGNRVDHLHGTSYKDVQKFDNLDVEAEIFRRVWLNDDVKKRQGKGIILNKGDEISIVKFPIPITKWKKHPQYASWNQNAIDKYTAQGYTVMNTNL
jgi:hypothetical protein